MNRRRTATTAILSLVTVVFMLAGCSNSGSSSPNGDTPNGGGATPSTSQPARTTPPEDDPTPEPAQTDPAPDNDDPPTAGTGAPMDYVVMETSLGDIVLELNREKAPITVENFLQYVNEGFYEGTIFHRVISNFMIQGGGFTQEFQKRDVRGGIENEWQNGLKNSVGTISMARVGGQPNSASSQFFINTNENVGLDRPQADGAAYAVFGKVIAGMDVVNLIRSVPVQRSRLNQRETSEPIDVILINKVTVITKEEAEAKAGG